MDNVVDVDQPSAAVGKRRRWTTSEKREIVEQSLAPGNSVPAVAAQHGVSASQVYRWVRLHRQASAAGSSSVALLPVTVAAPDCRRGERAPRQAAHQPWGTIQLEVGNAHLFVHGAADPCSLQLVLDYLLQ